MGDQPAGTGFGGGKRLTGGDQPPDKV